VFASLLDLRTAFSSSGPSEEIQFKPQRVVPVPRTPTTVTFASDDTRLLLGLSSGAVLVYDTSPLFKAGAGEVEPIRTWPIDAPNSLRQILPNPGEWSDQVAILRGSHSRRIIEIIDVRKLETIGGWLTPSLSTPGPVFSEVLH
jgi:nucleoporin NUP159